MSPTESHHPDLQTRGMSALLDTIGTLPWGVSLPRALLVGALNIERRWKQSSFFPAPATDQPGRAAARLRRSHRRLLRTIDRVTHRARRSAWMSARKAG